MTPAYTHMHGSYTPYMIRHQFIRVERWRNPEFFFLLLGLGPPVSGGMHNPHRHVVVQTPYSTGNRQIRDTHIDRANAFEHSDTQTKTQTK